MIISGKKVLISGGSSGIGLALAIKLASMKNHITILARDKSKLRQALNIIESFRVSPHQVFRFISADVSQYDPLRNALSTMGGSYDILINSAGLAYPGKFFEIPQEVFRQLMEVNYLGTVYLTKLVVPGMIDQMNGYIVNISSLAALVGIYGYTAYSPTKFALRGFSKCLRSELKPFNIQVSVVYPPDTETPQLAFERTILPEITRKINQGGGVLTAKKVADEIVRGMQRRKFNILPGFEGKVLYFFAPLFDRYFYHYAKSLAEKELKK